MARFNEQSVGTKTTNRAGGRAFKQTPELEMVSILLTSFANDQFYRKMVNGDLIRQIKEIKL